MRELEFHREKAAREILAFEQNQKVNEDIILKDLKDQEMRVIIEKLKHKTTKEELPVAIERIIDEKQMKDWRDLIM